MYINIYVQIYIYTYKNTYKYNYVIFASMHPVMVLYLIQSTLTFDSSGIHQICLTPAWHGLPLKKLQAKDCFLMSEIEEFLLKHVSRISTHNTSLGLFPRMSAAPRSSVNELQVSSSPHGQSILKRKQ